MYKKILIEQEQAVEIDWNKVNQDIEQQRRQQGAADTHQDNSGGGNRNRGEEENRRDDREDQNKPKPKVDTIQLTKRIDMIVHTMRFIERVYIQSPDREPEVNNLLKYMQNDLSGNTAKYVSLILNSFAHLNSIDKKYLNYVITANGQRQLPKYNFYAKDILDKLRYSGSNNSYPFRNLKNMFTFVVNWSLNYPFPLYSREKSLEIPAKQIIKLLNSRGIARMLPSSNTNSDKSLYTYTPLYTLYNDPNAQLKRLYDMKFFGDPIK